MSEPREFWIHVFALDPKDAMLESNAYHIKPNNWPKKPIGSYVHTIEYSAYESLLAKLKVYEEALQFYAHRNTWQAYANIALEDCGEIAISALEDLTQKGPSDE